ncbi:hypothetical protein [Flavobacterium sp. '19STA2R22 D10 B1']|uniref:hypothetical protein n=1 Tax=Flavobacterium aerium TaxID=3037261 RepID=UPI00278BF4D8|nr:hypothetical protein [Flavobacterium sp. '19STA2R22 D10 B1']
MKDSLLEAFKAKGKKIDLSLVKGGRTAPSMQWHCTQTSVGSDDYSTPDECTDCPPYFFSDIQH